MEPDFTGWATKAGLKCTDGRTIMPDAFKHQDQMQVPLVWQHGHKNPENVLGHAVLENRKEGVYCTAYFNGTPSAQNAKALVQHKDINSLSIYANQLVEKSKQVFHGVIREVSLVLAGANPGALIENVSLAHSDGEFETLEDEAVIYTGLLIHADGEESEEEENEETEEEEDLEHATAQEVFDTLTDEQKDLVHYMIGAALEEADANNSASHSDDSEEEENDNEDEENLEHQEGNEDMSRNVFENNGDTAVQNRPTLSHSQIKTIFEDAAEMGSLKASLLAHADEYGIGNIDLLFPDAKSVENDPQFVKRRTAWVAKVLDATKHSPFARIKSIFADITADDARAKGYLKGNLKKEEFFALAKRSTTPCTIYKKQKLDRDDIIDITDLDVVAWLKAEMRLMLDEEIAGAVLFGDGRAVDNPDKVLDPAGASSGPGIRSIAHDDPFYAIPAPYDSTASGWVPDALIDVVVNAMADYEGSGSPVLFTTQKLLNKILLQKDTLGRRLYANKSEVAQLMGVSDIIDVPESVVARAGATVKGVIVNLQDYTLGTDKGGEINMFDDFDIDYNQYKYLMEGRSSGALTKYHSAIVLKDAPAGP